MLLKKSRLKKKKDFERIFKKGRGISDDFLVFRTVKNFSEKSRFGFVVGKNVSKKANIRNKIKRRMRELVRKKMKEIKSGIDGVFIARPGLETKSFKDLEGSIDRIFIKLKIFRNL